MTRVLIVDDKEEALYYLRALLVGHGYEVEEARHGAEALVKARYAPPDLVISDLLMPVMDGYTLLRHWRIDPRLRSIPFMVYTATYTEAEDERLALSLGADAFLLKPSEPEDLLARLRAVLAGPASCPAKPSPEDTGDVLKSYSQTLIRKLEEKTLQLEQANRALQHDIQERRRVEDSLRESEERFRATFEQAAVGIAHVSAEGRLLRVNDKLCAIAGTAREELLGKPFSSLVLPEERDHLEECLRATLSGEKADFTVEQRCWRKTGEAIWINMVVSLLRDDLDGPRYFIAVVADIAERKRLEQQFLRAQRLESIGTLAGGIAHDLNNLLAPIMMGLELLRIEGIPPSLGVVMENMEGSARRAASLVRQVLSFARGLDGTRVRLPLRHVAREVSAIVESTFPKNIEWNCELPRDLWPVLGDATQLHQVLLNLCVNARDALGNGGHLDLRARNVTLDATQVDPRAGERSGPHVLIEVADNGCGMSPEVLDRIFEPFYTTKEPGKGTGLGLSTALGIVRGHGGRMDVESAPGKGTVFRILLPAQPDTPVSGERRVAGERPKSGHGEMILVVDDEVSIRDITRQTLEAFGYRVLTAKDGAEAIELYTKHREEVAAVITDMIMPTMDGPTLILALRRLNPSVRVIGVSGQASETPEEQVAPAATPGYFLQKPYSSDMLLGLLHKVLA